MAVSMTENNGGSLSLQSDHRSSDSIELIRHGQRILVIGKNALIVFALLGVVYMVTRAAVAIYGQRNQVDVRLCMGLVHFHYSVNAEGEGEAEELEDTEEAATEEAAPEEPVYYRVNVLTHLNVRTQPIAYEDEKNVVYKLHRGETVKVVFWVDDAWCQVHFRKADGTCDEGYVYGRYLNPIK